MKFFLLRRFSHLIHRRTRSDSALPELSLPSQRDFPHSLSLGDLVQQLGDYSRYPNALPPTESRTTTSNRPLLAESSENPSVAIFYVEQCISQLQKENAQLQVTREHIKTQLELKSTELYSYKTRIASLNHSLSKLNLVIEAFEQELVSLGTSIDSIDQSFVLLLDIAVCGPVFHRTRSAISSGFVFMDAIVDAIREAAEVPHSPWSALIPPVIGARSQDHYASALSITLRTRSDVRRIKNLARYWKSSAQEDEKHKDVITPSGSTLSEVQEVFTTERQKAVDALWIKLKSGELPIRSTVVSQAREEDTALIHAFTVKPSAPSVNASSLFMPPDPQSIKPQMSASVAASIVTLNASLTHSSSGESFPSTQSSGDSSIVGSAPSTSTRLCSEEAISPLPRLSLFSSDFWAAASNAGVSSDNIAAGHDSESAGSDFTTKDAIQSLELIYNRFNNMKLDTINEASPVCPADTILPEAHTTCVPAENAFLSETDILSSDSDESGSDFEADFVIVSIPTSAESSSAKKRNSILKSLNISSRIPRRISISLSPTSFKSRSPTKSAKTGLNVPLKKGNLLSTPDRPGDISKVLPMSVGSTTVRKLVGKTPKDRSTPSASRCQEARTSSPIANRPPSRPTISSSLKKTHSTSPSRSTKAANARNNIHFTSPRTGVAAASGSSQNVYASGRVDTMQGQSVASLSSMKKNRKNYPSRLPVQHHRPPPPVPAKGEIGRRDIVAAKKK
ncbi:hypothetical protein HHX47_DHR3000223 [Lentinula edodes]|nr:hypothetical protein HHX47_DHR3000223 [Lentinula edodes]